MILCLGMEFGYGNYCIALRREVGGLLGICIIIAYDIVWHSDGALLVEL